MLTALSPSKGMVEGPGSAFPQSPPFSAFSAVSALKTRRLPFAVHSATCHGVVPRNRDEAGSGFRLPGLPAIVPARRDDGGFAFQSAISLFLHRSPSRRDLRPGRKTPRPQNFSPAEPLLTPFPSSTYVPSGSRGKKKSLFPVDFSEIWSILLMEFRAGEPHGIAAAGLKF